MTAPERRFAQNFVRTLAQFSFKDAFNPYAEICSVHDRKDAPQIRRSNLEAAIEAALLSGVRSVWIARDLGYRGGRRTGLALTDEVHLSMYSRLMRTTELRRATKGPPIAERTASVVWRGLRAIGEPVFLWNIFPFHPHAADEPMSNRLHTKAERAETRQLLLSLLSALPTRTVLAIGRDAQADLADIGVEASALRHPSYGGQPEFFEGLAAHYGVPSDRFEDQGSLLDRVD